MAADEGTTVEASTTLGTVRGTWQRGVARFAGIPYAAPPVGDLRFRPPVPPAPWPDVRPATQFGPVAPQNPWGGTTLEWQAPTPPTLYNFPEPPEIYEQYVYDDLVEDEATGNWERKPSGAPRPAGGH